MKNPMIELQKKLKEWSAKIEEASELQKQREAEFEERFKALEKRVEDLEKNGK